MKVLKDVILRDHYDVIVIGAGLGGLTAASLLAKSGLRVLMIEQQNKPGGSCTSFKRADVVYDVGTAMIYGFGEKGFRPFRFLMNELEEPIDVVAHPTLARMTYEGHPIVFWSDVNRFLDELGSLFPEEKVNLRAFYADLYKMYENIVIKNEVVVPPSEFTPRQKLRRLLSSPLSILKMQKLLSTSVKDLLDQYFHTEEIIDFFDKLCSAYCYCTAEETPAVLAATMFLDNHIGGVYYPAGGAQMLPNKFEKAFERNGGQVLYRHLVNEILMQNGQAYGVRLDNDLEIYSDRVVANATVWNLYGKLIKPEHIDPAQLAWARALVPTYPSMTLYMLVDPEALPADAMPWEIFIENREVIDSSDLTLYINSLVDQSLCPPGKLVVMAIAPNLCAWPSPQDPEYQSEAYQSLKQREAECMLDQIEKHYPGFRQHIHSLIVGTPTTIERYLLKNGGAVGGPKNAIGQQMLKRLHARSAWKNLYFCGDSTVMATGAPATAVSGVGAANMVLRDMRKKEYDTRKFPRQYVHFVDLPYKQPSYQIGEPISTANAHREAAACQWCETPACVAGCPAGIDIPGFLRRIEAKNYIGAARLLRERNPFAEVCGYTCAANPPCEANCYRNSFAGKSVCIAALQRWVCEVAGVAGWLEPDTAKDKRSIAIVGSSPAGLCCAYYLALMGFNVDILDEHDQPSDRLRQVYDEVDLPRVVLERDLGEIMQCNVHFKGGSEMGNALSIQKLLGAYDALYVTVSVGEFPQFGASTRLDAVGTSTQSVADLPGVYISGDLLRQGQSIVKAAADGRRAAVAIGQYLYSQKNMEP